MGEADGAFSRVNAWVSNIGAPVQNRTGNLPLTRRVLCQLSYRSGWKAKTNVFYLEKKKKAILC